jgi:hypothetical protein
VGIENIISIVTDRIKMDLEGRPGYYQQLKQKEKSGDREAINPESKDTI